MIEIRGLARIRMRGVQLMLGMVEKLNRRNILSSSTVEVQSPDSSRSVDAALGRSGASLPEYLPNFLVSRFAQFFHMPRKSKQSAFVSLLLQATKRPVIGYSIALLNTFAVVGFRSLLTPYIGVEPPVFQLFDFAVFASALLGGFGPGALSTVLLCLASRLWFFDGTSAGFHLSFAEGLRYYTFVIEALVIAGTCSYLRKVYFFVDEGLADLKLGLEREEKLRQENVARKSELKVAEGSRAQALVSLKESEEHLLLAISAAEMGTWDVAVKEDRIHYSALAAKVFGAGEAAGACSYREFLDRIYPEDLAGVKKVLRRVLRKHSKAEFVLDFRTKMPSFSDSEMAPIRDRWISVRGRVFFENERAARLIGIVVDVTARQEAHEAILRLKNDAEQSSFAKTRFLANISHEIRTPLGAILGFAELMLDPSQTDRDREDCLHTILRNGESLRHVIDDILDVVTIENEKLNLTQRKFSVRQLIDDLSSSLKVVTRQKGIDLDIDIESKIPLEIQSDPLRLRQILENILGNAIKFTSRGGVSVEVRILSAAQALGNSARQMIEFKVTDSGVGMTEEQKLRAFQMFSQGNSSFDRQFGGSGLGLFLSRRLAQELGGDLTLLESNPGRGSTFVLRIDSGLSADSISGFVSGAEAGTETVEQGTPATSEIAGAQPVLLPAIPQIAPTAALPGEFSPPLGGMKVLIVDDAPDNCILIARYLRKAGATTESADNGLKGMNDAQSHDYDVVLMDLQMPVLDGYKAIESLREAHYDKPIVAITAHALKGERERCLQVGADEFLQKPVDRGELIRVVEQYRHEPTEDQREPAPAMT